MTISGAAKVANTKQDFLALKEAQAKSDIRQKFAGGMGEVDPEVGDLNAIPRRNRVASALVPYSRRVQGEDAQEFCSCRGSRSFLWYFDGSLPSRRRVGAC